MGAGALGLALSGCSIAASPESSAAVAPAAKPRSGPKQLRGLFPIAGSPYTQDDKLDLASLAAQVAFCNRGGVHGLVWPQIASGWTNLSEPERLAGAEAMLAEGKGGATALVIGVQSKTGDFKEVERYATHAATHGADAIVSLPPPGVSDEKVLLAYYQQVGKMTSLPLFVQSQGTMSVDLAVEIFRTIPTARYLKDEAAAGGGPLQCITEIRKRTNDEMKVFSGQGVRTLMTEMELGFSGHCPVVALSDIYAAAFDLFHAGRRREAFDMFGRVLAFNSVGASGDSIMIARGVFPRTVKSRAGGGGGGGGGGGEGRSNFQLDEQGVRDALNNYLKPYLRG